MNLKKIKLAILAFSSVMMASQTASAVLADISAHFSQVEPSIIQMVLTIPSLVGMIFALISGPLSSKIAKKTLVLAGLVSAFTGATLAFLFGESSIVLLLFASGLIGIGQGISSTMSMALIADYFVGDECSSLMGIQSAFLNGGNMIVLFLSGLLAGIQWNYSYIVYLVFIPVIIIVMKNLPGKVPVLAVKTDIRHKGRLNGKVYFICFVTFSFSILMGVFQTNISMYINHNALGDATASGFASSLIAGFGALTGIFYGRLKAKFDQILIPMGFMAAGIGMLILFIFQTLPAVYVAAAFVGFSISLIIPSVMFIASSSVAPSERATAIGLTNAAIGIAMFTSPILMNPLAYLLGDGSERTKFIIAAVGLLAGALLIAFKNMRMDKVEDCTEIGF
ncbi:MAG: MFS transporter [Eubacteriaceae bacterium]|nr:MFS transporter [Eubacteriaceae bacterium]